MNPIADCAGGSPCTTCPDKRQCGKTGCIRQPEFISTEFHAPSAARAAGVPTAPEGFLLLPVEATDSMMDADWNVTMSEAHSNGGVAAAAWRAMVEVAPQVTYANGHSGLGWYMHDTDYPEEGAVFLGASSATPSAPEAAPQERIKYVPVDASLRDKNWQHPNDDEPCDAACKKALNDRGDDEGQGLDSYWKWGFRAGWNARSSAPQEAMQGQQAVGRFIVKGKGRSSVDLDATHADLPPGEYTLYASPVVAPGADADG